MVSSIHTFIHFNRMYGLAWKFQHSKCDVIVSSSIDPFIHSNTIYGLAWKFQYSKCDVILSVAFVYLHSNTEIHFQFNA